jgi:hypothetical protein
MKAKELSRIYKKAWIKARRNADRIYINFIPA